jgi:DNA methyltransferase 1-associated protein 1
MGDVADMLGLAVSKASGPANATEEAIKFLTESKSKPENKQQSKLLKKPKGMKREVFDLLGKDGIVPAVQSSSAASAGGFKTKRTIANKGKWVYLPIENSARSDNQLTFRHWVKAEINYSDYPYAKFNVKLEKIVFSDEEYQAFLNDENWTKEDTRTLIDTCHIFDLRWPVIFDRISLRPTKTPEEIQNRYYTVVNKLYAARDQTDKKLYEYDVEKETKRRTQQDSIFKR